MLCKEGTWLTLCREGTTWLKEGTTWLTLCKGGNNMANAM